MIGNKSCKKAHPKRSNATRPAYLRVPHQLGTPRLSALLPSPWECLCSKKESLWGQLGPLHTGSRGATLTQQQQTHLNAAQHHVFPWSWAPRGAEQSEWLSSPSQRSIQPGEQEQRWGHFLNGMLGVHINLGRCTRSGELCISRGTQRGGPLFSSVQCSHMLMLLHA